MHDARSVIDSRWKLLDAVALLWIFYKYGLDARFAQSAVELPRLLRGRTAIQRAADVQVGVRTLYACSSGLRLKYLPPRLVYVSSKKRLTNWGIFEMKCQVT